MEMTSLFVLFDNFVFYNESKGTINRWKSVHIIVKN